MKATREGRRFLLATFLIAVAAFNTGNNLIYLILSLMISFLIIAVVALKLNLHKISLEIYANPPVFAGESTYLTVLLKNNKRYLHSYSIRVIVEGAEDSIYCDHLVPETVVKKEIKIRFPKRGIYSYGKFSIQSGFPFILFQKKLTAGITGEVLVYPAINDVNSIIGDIKGYSNYGNLKMAGAGEDIHSIREFRYGDDWRRIHWKASAKTSSLMVKEYALYENRKITIIIDNNNVSYTEEDLFEKVVSLTASLARYFLDAGYFVRIVSCKKVIPFGSGNEHLFTILDILALIKEEESSECPVSLDSDGIYVLALKSSSSPVNRYSTISDMVLYADTL